MSFCRGCKKLEKFLKTIQLEFLQSFFAEQMIDFHTLSTMTDKQMKENGLEEFGIRSRILGEFQSQCFFAFDNCALSSFNKCYFEDIRLLSQYYPVCDHCNKRLG